MVLKSPQKVLNFYYRIFEYFEVGPGQLLLNSVAFGEYADISCMHVL